MATDPVAFGKRMRELREAVGLSPTAAARRAGFSGQYWTTIEEAKPQGRNRQPSMPRPPVVRSIALVLDADAAELLELAGYEDIAAWDRVHRSRAAARKGLIDISDLEEGEREMVLGAIEVARRRREAE